ncbi:hypothetical protein CWT12_12245 [Actinomyces sp. 432]|uniref:hypothetical protein n=1 Tax=Actinomyces sp. 432 TaxID=2057798 RepID=UPI0013740F95|nr:hypothetical protein [Actinomyces sp. 432]QHO91922.1 hypothetical protein CWT12_12245 [Actinomyces sp. 432]
MTLMRITAPCQVDGRPLGVDAIGRVVAVTHESERLRLLRAGQAVDAPPAADGEKAATPHSNKQHHPHNKQETLP